MTSFFDTIKSISLQLKLVCVIIFCLPLSLLAQNDSLRLKNNDFLVGEVKSFKEGILTIETSYSDKDFKIEFNKVSELIIQRKCFILLTEGRRLFGNIRTDGTGLAVISLDNGSVEKYPLKEVIALKEVDDNFWQRFIGAIDLGYNLTKSNNSKQFTIGGKLYYVGEILRIEGSVNTLNANQDDAEKTRRTDANLELTRTISRNWYFLGEISFLSNTEQALDARISPSLGFGKLLISTNKLVFGLSIGFTFNIEDYVDASLNKTSSEAFIASSFKMFDFEDFDLSTGIKFYPSLSEKDRLRTDYNLTLKYDLPLDFYVKMEFDFNYDNQPAVMGKETDYIFSTGFGWDFD